MSDLLTEVQDKICLITLNRVDKSNAFDNHLLSEMQQQLHQANNNSKVRVILLKANGAHFSAGADMGWMKSMVQYSEEENLKDALVLGQLMHDLHHSAKPTVAVVQGSAFGGGAGLAAACTMAIAAQSARFCFSEVKLGLIPAVISPYVVKAMGERNAQMLFISAEVFDATKAYSLGLVQHCVIDDELLSFSINYANKIANNAPDAVTKSLQLARYVAGKPINEELVHYTASLIAKKRISTEGLHGLNAFLNKEPPNWT
jgi:methylglutaconyl-CoA hydratase